MGQTQIYFQQIKSHSEEKLSFLGKIHSRDQDIHIEVKCSCIAHTYCYMRGKYITIGDKYRQIEEIHSNFWDNYVYILGEKVILGTNTVTFCTNTTNKRIIKTTMGTIQCYSKGDTRFTWDKYSQMRDIYSNIGDTYSHTHGK